MMKYMRKRKDLGITGGMARWYDKNSRESRMAELSGYAKEISTLIKPAAAGEKRRILEIAPGPGYISIELSKLGDYTITGMDISADFVEIARANAKRENAGVDFTRGNVSAMPFDDAAFDFLFCSAAFKNFHDPERALREMHRVLAPGGGGLIIDMNRNASGAALKAELDGMRLHGLSRLWMNFVFAAFLRKGAYSKAELDELLAASPFSSWNIAERGIGLYVYLQK